MSTKRSRHGQGDESLVVISFGVDSDMDLGSVFHIIQRWHRFFYIYDILSLTRARHRSSLSRWNILYDLTHHRRQCNRLGGLFALSVCPGC